MIPTSWQELPARVALHPTLPHLLTIDAAGVVDVLDLKGEVPTSIARRSRTASPVDPAFGVAIGGPEARPLAAWIDPEGVWLWAYTAADGPAATPTCLSGLARFLGERQGRRDRFERVLLAGGRSGRWWLGLTVEGGGFLVSNGRLSTLGGPRQQLLALAADPTGHRVALLTDDGALTLIEDPQQDDPESDPLGPALLDQHHTACPIEATSPVCVELELPHAGTFGPAARLWWRPDMIAAVTLCDGLATAPDGWPLRHLHRCRLDGLDPVELDEQPLPSDLDFMLQPLDDACSRWLDPAPQSVIFWSADTNARELVPLERLVADGPPVLEGHPALAAPLFKLGLRWDGAELYHDRLRPDLARAWGRRWTAPPLAEPAWTGPLDVQRAWTSPCGDYLLLMEAAQADRLLLMPTASPAEARVLPHPQLLRVPREVLLATARRPPVVLRSLAFDAATPYLGMWRHPGGVELWSLRAADRLKAWPVPRWDRAFASRLVLRPGPPGYLPSLLMLAALSRTDGSMEVEVGAVEFGERRVRVLGVAHLPATTDLNALVPSEHDEATWHLGERVVRFKARD